MAVAAAEVSRNLVPIVEGLLVSERRIKNQVDLLNRRVDIREQWVSQVWQNLKSHLLTGVSHLVLSAPM